MEFVKRVVSEKGLWRRFYSKKDQVFRSGVLAKELTTNFRHKKFDKPCHRYRCLWRELLRNVPTAQTYRQSYSKARKPAPQKAQASQREALPPKPKCKIHPLCGLWRERLADRGETKLEISSVPIRPRTHKPSIRAGSSPFNWDLGLIWKLWFQSLTPRRCMLICLAVGPLAQFGRAMDS